MISGEVSGDQQALVTIEITDAEGSPRPVEVILDIGFTGYLTLPAETIRQLGLSSVGGRTFELANGELFEFEAYVAAVSWHGRLTDTLVLRSDSAPLLGMTLLWGSRVTLDAVAQGEVRIEALEPGASRDTPPIKMGHFGRLWGFVKSSFFAVAFGTGVTAGIVAFAFGVDSLPLDFGEILTFMGIWLVLGVLFGENKPLSMSLAHYLGRRIISVVCCYVFFIAIAVVYVLRDGDASEEITRKELWGLFVLSLVSFAVGLFAGQDKERKQC